MNKKHKSTEGEEIIEFYLEDQGIKFEREVKIQNLKYDSKPYRVADFYLPQYKIYIEFLGEWNDPEGRRDYQAKKHVYKENEIPCVYIYPDNLGPLDIVFRMRMRQQFENFPELKPQQSLYNFLKYKQAFWIFLSAWFGLMLIFIISDNIYSKKLNISMVSLVVPTIFISVLVVYTCIKIFPKKKGK